MTDVTHSPLGKETRYPGRYSPSCLFPIPRSGNRAALNLGDTFPFHGIDIWTAYELSWLNSKGKPLVAMASFIFPFSSPNLIESKSFKLYLNSFNQSSFSSPEEVKKLLEQDLSHAAGVAVGVDLQTELSGDFCMFEGNCLDDLDIVVGDYQLDSKKLKAGNEVVEEKLYSHLLKSNCPVTSQPDWATVYFHYRGPKIDHEGLLRYIISFRSHNEFHEHCVETMFVDIKRQCRPEFLTVYARYTRRGGLDINPFRSDFPGGLPPGNIRTYRQ